MNVEVTIFPPDGTDVQTRTLAYGMEPLVTIEPSENLLGELNVQITSSKLDMDDLQELFAFLAETMQTGERRQRILSPDCLDKNHHKCDLKAWDDDADALTECGCVCHDEKEDDA